MAPSPVVAVALLVAAPLWLNGCGSGCDSCRDMMEKIENGCGPDCGLLISASDYCSACSSSCCGKVDGVGGFSASEVQATCSSSRDDLLCDSSLSPHLPASNVSMTVTAGMSQAAKSKHQVATPDNQQAEKSDSSVAV